MFCPQCGNDNPSKLKFCVKCGMNLENPSEVNYEQVDMGGYHTEDDPNSCKFSFGSGTFTISDNVPASNMSSDLYTADELNDDGEEFDFSSFDEPYIPKLDADRVSLPNTAAPQQPMAGIPQMGNAPQQPMAGIPPMGTAPQQPMAGIPPMGGVPQQNGMPVYGQPMMYPQPQIIGYDQNGMPIYGQPMMYTQPQFVGYDQNGMPVYTQPAPIPQPDPMAMQGIPQMGGIPQPMTGVPQMGGIPAPTPQPVQKKDPDRVDVPDDFWEFFDGGKSRNPDKDNEDDFFGRSALDSAEALTKKKTGTKHYMRDTPLVDADKLMPNTASKYNSLLMRKTDIVNAEDLEAHADTKKQDIMAVTREVDAAQLNSYEHYKSRISMGEAGEADADSLEAYVPEHQEAIMSQNIDAVEALPKKKTTYNDEIDAIELPEYMQARKTAADNTPEIPDLPEI